MDRKIGSGLGTNSYGITTVNGRVNKYNSLREQILLSSQQRGLNVGMNQTLSEINKPRRYTK
jgi:hypothetical protein